MSIKGPTGRRLALISEALYSELKAKAEKEKQTESGQFEKVLDIDAEIKRLLEDKSLRPDEKAQRYAQLANEYLKYRHITPEIQTAKHSSVPAGESKIGTKEPEEAEAEEEEGELSDQDIISGFAERRQTKIAQILRGFQYFPSKIRYDRNTGEVILNNERIADSSIYELVDYISKPTPSSKSKPVGIGRFLQQLGKLVTFNMSLIPNEGLRQFAQKLRQTASTEEQEEPTSAEFQDAEGEKMDKGFKWSQIS
ncbi:MAG: hypothetical protein GY858_05460 [Candidatus Omnitrophica bacterium]|nr:hypothetical protein [Candidatus Omnitrophota bacterium]